MDEKDSSQSAVGNGQSAITAEPLMPEDGCWRIKKETHLHFDPEFVKWIKSINAGFRKRITNYEPFEQYKREAARFMQGDLYQGENRDELRKMVAEERRKVNLNSLYFFNRYVILKEGNSPTGFIKPIAFECQAILSFIFDNGFNMVLGKPRQIGGSSLFLPLFMKRAICRKSYFVKFICEDEKKTTEIFNDKLKFPFFHLPFWMKPHVLNDSNLMLTFGKKDGKGKMDGAESKVSVQGPSVTAINGGSPNCVGVDEGVAIPILAQMIDEGRPTLYFYNPATGKLEMRRQLIIWGSSGGEEEDYSDDGMVAFESIFTALLEGFGSPDDTTGIVPIFLDWGAKAGMDEKEYENQKRYYYSKKGNELARSIIRFRQHFPSKVDDMFIKSYETICDYNYILARLDKSRKHIPKYGYFEPIFDTSIKMPDNFPVPHPIRGATFVPVGDSEMFLAPICIIRPPEEGWKNRYYQGTDPIASKSGHSKFASAIWDEQERTISAGLNFRHEDYRQTYIQSICLGLYYDTRIKDLLEINIGGEYANMKDTLGLYPTLVMKKELPLYLQIGSQDVGIEKRTVNKDRIVNKCHELVTGYGDGIEAEWLWEQLKTFVKKNNKTGTSFGPRTRHNWDDFIDACTYAYICRQCFPHLMPIGNNDAKKKRVLHRYECSAETGWQNRLVKKMM